MLWQGAGHHNLLRQVDKCYASRRILVIDDVCYGSHLLLVHVRLFSAHTGKLFYFIIFSSLYSAGFVSFWPFMFHFLSALTCIRKMLNCDFNFFTLKCMALRRWAHSLFHCACSTLSPAFSTFVFKKENRCTAAKLKSRKHSLELWCHQWNDNSKAHPFLLPIW